jgi:transcription termination factor NusG
MQSRRSFFKAAILGGAAFTAGLKLGGGLDFTSRSAATLHAFVPADENAVRQVLQAFLALNEGALPTPTVDVPAPWRTTVAGELRQAADRYQRQPQQLFDVQLAQLEKSLPADLLLQHDARVMDPASKLSRQLLSLRESLLGQEALVAVTCRLGSRPSATAAGRVLVVETENGVQDRIALDGNSRNLSLAGPAGRTEILVDASGARVSGASCRHETCRRQGLVSQPGELIACAPNRIVLRVETV